MKIIIRDVAIVWILTFLSGFVVGFAMANGVLDPSRIQLGAAASNLVFGIVGFTIVGVFTKADRFKHMTKVVFVLWLLGLVNVYLVQGFGFTQWMLSLVFIFVAMAIGGVISVFSALSTHSKEPAA